MQQQYARIKSDQICWFLEMGLSAVYISVQVALSINFGRWTRVWKVISALRTLAPNCQQHTIKC